MTKKQLNNTLALFARLAKLAAPPPNLTISEWADANRVLSAGPNSVPGPWRTDFTPYLRAIQDAICDPAVDSVVVKSCARVGKTSALLHAIGYYIDLDPAPIMVVLPTTALAEKFSKKYLAPLLRETDCLRGKVKDIRTKDSSNTILYKEFPGGSIGLSGANSPASLSMDTIKIVLIDEADRCGDAGDEGSSIKLAEARTTTFINKGRKIVYTSTPTNKGSSNIESAYLESNQQRWCLPCPTCGAYQPLEWRRLDFGTMKHACRDDACGGAHTRREWLGGKGKWIAENPGHPTQGFHLNALVSPFVTWDYLVDEWRKANIEARFGQHNKLQVFINTLLGEEWEIPGARADESGLMERREIYYADVPDGVCLTTMGVDTQDNRLCYTLWGWGAGKESWALEYGELWGDPRVPGSMCWAQLDEVIQKRRTYAGGRPVKVNCTAIDMGGHAPDQVCTYAKMRQGWNVWAVRGVGGYGKEFIKSSGRHKKTGATFFNLGVDTGKEEMSALLRVPRPVDEDVLHSGRVPGYVHFPKGLAGEFVRGFDERYFSGLTSEKRIAKRLTGNFHKYVWEKQAGRSNEPWDCFNYALAALTIATKEALPFLERIAEVAPWTYALIDMPAAPTASGQKPLKRRSGGMRLNEAAVLNPYTAV